MTERVVVVNADDFGASDGVNRGIVEAHARGIVTSTSLMVDGAAAAAAVALAGDHPRLGVGLHWTLDGEEGEPFVDFDDAAAVRAELSRQLETFRALIGGPPTHLDSHHHVHRRSDVAPIARELAAPLGVPLRGESSVTYVGGFYGQWEEGVTDLHHVSPEFLIWILRHEVGEGWTEIGCHPGRVTEDFRSPYLSEREVELVTLTDPRVRDELGALGIRLASYSEMRLTRPPGG
jgi:predicted glycoside hydrolase/deacetylase ChbG (UPF0249 family)